MRGAAVRPWRGRSSVTTAGEPVTIAPVGKVHLVRRPATFAAVMRVSAGLKKRRRGPPAYAGQSVAAAGPAARSAPRRTAAARASALADRLPALIPAIRMAEDGPWLRMSGGRRPSSETGVVLRATLAACPGAQR